MTLNNPHAESRIMYLAIKLYIISYAIPFTTNVTISTSISQTVLSRVATFHLRIAQAYGVFISQLIRYARACSSYECLILRETRLSCKLLGQGTFEIVTQEVLWLIQCNMRISSIIMKPPLFQILHAILGHDHIQWHPPLIRHFTKLWPLYRTGPY